MNGALNNASMALEVALGDASAADATTQQTLRAGLAAIGKASRAAALLAHIVHGRGAPPDPDGSYLRDVREILGDHARSTGHTLTGDLDASAGTPAQDAVEAANLLVAELSRMQAHGG